MRKEIVISQVKSMIRGLVEQIEETELTPAKAEMLEKMTAKLEYIEQCPEDRLHLTAQQVATEALEARKLLGLEKKKKRVIEN
jgi:hypothetical protein